MNNYKNIKIVEDMRMIAIIDYDAGNIKSVEKALKYLGEDAVITRDREEILLPIK